MYCSVLSEGFGPFVLSLDAKLGTYSGKSSLIFSVEKTQNAGIKSLAIIYISS